MRYEHLTLFVDIGSDYYTKFNTEKKIQSYLKKRIALGWQPSDLVVV